MKFQKLFEDPIFPLSTVELVCFPSSHAALFRTRMKNAN